MIAGGTDMVIGLRNGSLRPRCLVDITRIEEIRKIEEEGDCISIGAGATHSNLASSPLLHRFGRVLSVAASSVGSPQIRNLGTLGGNIVNASPAADTLPSLMVLDAVGRVASIREERDIPLVQLFNRPYQSILKPFEILTHVRFPKLPAGTRSGFIRLARREAMAVARMSVAVIARLEGGRFQDIRISAGSVTPTPHRMSEAEAVLKERAPDEESLRLAARRVSDTIVRWSGVRPSTSYKVPVIEALFLRAMREVLEGLG